MLTVAALQPVALSSRGGERTAGAGRAVDTTGAATLRTGTHSVSHEGASPPTLPIDANAAAEVGGWGFGARAGTGPAPRSRKLEGRGAGMKKGRGLRGGPSSGEAGGWRRLLKRLGAVTVGYKCH